jgi:hypothetical protein
MTDEPKLTLSAEELQLVTNTQWILTKRVIIDKVNLLFGNLSVVFSNHVIANDCFLQPAIVQSTPKIAKGENYLQLPYVLLDYPRCFDKENIFTIRTMFWWGNFFSITLHLSGKYKQTFETALQKNIPTLVKPDFYVCINEDEWQHHFKADNYMPVNKLTLDEINSITQRRFIKAAIKFPLEKWDTMPSLLEQSFLDLLQLIRN